VPIDTDAFEHGDHRDSVEREILAFLQENPEKAYNAREITNTVMDVRVRSETSTVRATSGVSWPSSSTS